MKINEIASQIRERISVSAIRVEDYVSTDNMRPNYGGIEKSLALPPSGTVTAFHKGDILLSNIRPYFRKTWLATHSGGCNADVLCIRANPEKCLPKYLYYLFTTDNFVMDYLKSCKGAKMPRGDVQRLLDYEFDLPDLPTQLRIAGVLGSIDEKIELNRKKIAELEALAKTIYDYWFVQFDFPDKNGKPYKSSGGKMVWNDQLKREVPEGWEVKRLEQVCDRIQSGGTPESKNEAYYGGSIPWFTTQELKDSWVSHSAKTITSEAVRSSAAKVFPTGTVLLAIYAAPTVGRLALLSVDATFNQACCGFVAGKEISKEYLFITLYEARAKLNSIADGTAQKNLSVGRMRTFDMLVPQKSVMAQWRVMTEPIFDSIKIVSANIDDLTSCRDRILPLLMNGQVEMAG